MLDMPVQALLNSALLAMSSKVRMLGIFCLNPSCRSFYLVSGFSRFSGAFLGRAKLVVIAASFGGSYARSQMRVRLSAKLACSLVFTSKTTHVCVPICSLLAIPQWCALVYSLNIDVPPLQTASALPSRRSIDRIPLR